MKQHEPLVPTRIVLGVSLFMAVLLGGTLAYRIVEGTDWFTSVYLTVVMMTTVGDSSGRPISTTGQFLSLAVVLAGFSAMTYVLLSALPYVLEGHFASAVNNRGMRLKVRKMRDHFIVCGYGRVGAEVAHHLAHEHMAFLVIDNVPDALADAARRRYTVIEGNAADSAVLEHAGIRTARCLIAAVNSDADNLYVTVAARVLRPELLVVARANTPEAEQRLKFAGANHILSPYKTAGRLMAQMAVHPNEPDTVDDLALPSSH